LDQSEFAGVVKGFLCYILHCVSASHWLGMDWKAVNVFQRLNQRLHVLARETVLDVGRIE